MREETIRVDTGTASMPLFSISARSYAKSGLCSFFILRIAGQNDLLVLVVANGRGLLLSEQIELISARIASKHDIKRLLCLLDGGFPQNELIGRDASDLIYSAL